MSATAPMGHGMPALIREAYPRHAAKSAARAARVPHETARNWVRGRAAPSAETLLAWAARCDAMAAALERRMNEIRAARRGGGDAAMDGARAAACRPTVTRDAPAAAE